MKIISILNHKGGVGKTTTTLHLGSYLSRKKRVLLIDFDRQRNLTKGYNVSNDIDFTINDFHYPYKKKVELAEITNHKNLYLLKGHKKLFWKGKSIKEEMETLNEILKQQNIKPFEVVLIDCPPAVPEPYGINNRRLSLGEIALISSDYLISILEADSYSIDGLDELINTFVNVKKRYNKKLEFGGMFFNMVEKNTKKFKKNYKEAINNESLKEHFFKSYVRKDEAIFHAKEKGISVFHYNKNSRVSKDFEKIGKEIKNKLIIN